MKGVICYYSGSGNTKLACRYIAKNIQDVEFDLFDIVKGGTVDLTEYDIVGLAAFTDFFAPSQVMQTFVENLPRQNDKPAFVFNTFGFITGKTVKVLEQWANARGFHVVAGHSLHTPESHPPTISRGRPYTDSPNEKEMARFNEFIAGLGQLCATIKGGQPGTSRKVSVGLLNSLMPTIARTQAQKEMGEKYVDEALCTQCGTCEKGCPYQAIKLSPFPTFDDKCYGCWRCYNRCPKHAIYTNKYREGPFYPKPVEQLKAKLRV
ncbi:MAG: hypothetical protein GY832_10800 [Chloroflexi bacterium]|nr:hypothetical protein [Chloroflexota bacterium]